MAILAAPKTKRTTRNKAIIVITTTRIPKFIQHKKAWYLKTLAKSVIIIRKEQNTYIKKQTSLEINGIRITYYPESSRESPAKNVSFRHSLCCCGNHPHIVGI